MLNPIFAKSIRHEFVIVKSNTDIVFTESYTYLLFKIIIKT